MRNLGHVNKEALEKIIKKHIKEIAALGVPEKDIKRVINDLLSMDLLRINKDDELEVFDGKEWQNIKL